MILSSVSFRTERETFLFKSANESLKKNENSLSFSITWNASLSVTFLSSRESVCEFAVSAITTPRGINIKSQIFITTVVLISTDRTQALLYLIFFIELELDWWTKKLRPLLNGG